PGLASLSSSNDAATIEIYTLSLHDALPICGQVVAFTGGDNAAAIIDGPLAIHGARHFLPAEHLLTLVQFDEDDLAAPSASSKGRDRKSTRLNSSHVKISYAVFCLKKKNKQQ